MSTEQWVSVTPPSLLFCLRSLSCDRLGTYFPVFRFFAKDTRKVNTRSLQIRDIREPTDHLLIFICSFILMKTSLITLLFYNQRRRHYKQYRSHLKPCHLTVIPSLTTEDPNPVTYRHTERLWVSEELFTGTQKSF